METVTFTDLDISALVIALQSYAIAMENKQLYSSAALYFDLAAKAASAIAWDSQATGFVNSAAYCRKHELAA